MNNNITEDYCSFEVSKLLKEKKFDINIDSFYLKGEPILNGIKNPLFGHYKSDIVKRPTHALAIKWIRENFGIFFDITPNWVYQGKFKGYWFKIYSLKNGVLLYETNKSFNSPEEVTEAALLYTLKNLIL